MASVLERLEVFIAEPAQKAPGEKYRLLVNLPDIDAEGGGYAPMPILEVELELATTPLELAQLIVAKVNNGIQVLVNNQERIDG